MSDRTRDDETKQYGQEYTDDDFLEAVRECPVASTGEIAEAVGCYRKTVLDRLGKLEKQGEVGHKKVSGKAKVWYIDGE